jgi:hypothetical protein
MSLDVPRDGHVDPTNDTNETLHDAPTVTSPTTAATTTDGQNVSSKDVENVLYSDVCGFVCNNTRSQLTDFPRLESAHY